MYGTTNTSGCANFAPTLVGRECMGNQEEVVVTTIMEDRVEDRRPLRADVSPALRQRVKVRAAQEGLTMRQYIVAALERDLEARDAVRGGTEKPTR